VLLNLYFVVLIFADSVVCFSEVSFPLVVLLLSFYLKTEMWFDIGVIPSLTELAGLYITPFKPLLLAMSNSEPNPFSLSALVLASYLAYTSLIALSVSASFSSIVSLC